jgi:hypothetical protein
LQHLHVGRSDRVGGAVIYRGRRVHRRETNECPPGRDPVEAGAPWVVVGSVGQLGSRVSSHAAEVVEKKHGVGEVG